MSMGQYVQKMREESGLTQQELADKLGIARGSLARIERNYSTMSLTLAIQIADIFQCSLDALTGRGEKK